MSEELAAIDLNSDYLQARSCRRHGDTGEYDAESPPDAAFESELDVIGYTIELVSPIH